MLEKGVQNREHGAAKSNYDSPRSHFKSINQCTAEGPPSGPGKAPGVGAASSCSRIPAWPLSSFLGLAYYVGCMRTTILYLLLCISLTAALSAPGRAGEKDLEWKTGKLIDVQTRGRGRHAATYYAIDGGDLIYLAQRTVTRRDKPLNVTVHGKVRFAVKGSDIYLLDDDGKQHRLTLEKKTAKAGP